MAADLENDPLADDQEDSLFVDQTETSGDADLEQYGVWVKVAPEDVDDEASAEDDIGLDALSSEDTADGAVLTEEEEQLLGNLEGGTDAAEPESELGDLSDIALDDFTVDIELAPNTPESAEPEAFDDLAEPEDTLGDGDIADNLPDMDFDTELADLDDELASLDIPEAVDEVSSEYAGVPDLSLDETDDILPGADEELNNIELDDLGQTDAGEDLAELEVEDTDLSPDLGLDSLDSTLADSLDPDEGALDLPEDAFDLFEDDTDISSDLPDEPIDDLASLQSDLETDEEFAEPDAALPPLENSGLERIEQELRSIKDELRELKAELSDLKNTPPATGTPPPQEPDDAGVSGFFTEDEDETISLTGDELDNILNTADITEETVEETEAPDDGDILGLSQPLDGPSIEEAMAPEEGLLMDRDDLIPLDQEPELSLDDLDFDEPEVDAAEQTQTIDLAASDELLGEILQSDQDLLGETDSFDNDLQNLEMDSMDLDGEPMEALGDDLQNLGTDALELEDEPVEALGDLQDLGTDALALDDESMESLSDDLQDLEMDDLELESEPMEALNDDLHDFEMDGPGLEGEPMEALNDDLQDLEMDGPELDAEPMESLDDDLQDLGTDILELDGEPMETLDDDLQDLGIDSLELDGEPMGALDDDIQDFGTDSLELDGEPMEPLGDDLQDLEMDSMELDGEPMESLGDDLQDFEMDSLELETEPIDHDLQDLEMASLQADEEPTGVEDADIFPEGDNLDLELEPARENTIELEELAEEDEFGQEPAEELELDIAGDVVDLSDSADDDPNELSIVDLDSDTEADELLMDDIEDEIELDDGLDAADLEMLTDFEEGPEIVPSDAPSGELPEDIKQELKSVLSYMDHLLESLPEEKIQEFAQSEHFEVYKKLFEELGLES
jgi:pilus assembly protein FimV